MPLSIWFSSNQSIISIEFSVWMQMFSCDSSKRWPFAKSIYWFESSVSSVAINTSVVRQRVLTRSRELDRGRPPTSRLARSEQWPRRWRRASSHSDLSCTRPWTRRGRRSRKRSRAMWVLWTIVKINYMKWLRVKIYWVKIFIDSIANITFLCFFLNNILSKHN